MAVVCRNLTVEDPFHTRVCGGENGDGTGIILVINQLNAQILVL